ncbi:NAD-dependent dihydropyrimidine dehydrogenase subunit PreA [Papillibacter cinnamivorans]|uniref:Dihydroorotate dehydrogenase B (NAD(+)), catalytic subunit n=1 Tax=Papillibacter cinnamivorans DSM 12816 TaxID=1122930 RepID=A0A1W2AUS7_9FIRM|nr:NAD-dependent dihydropyrimidine dehydrogenase subunit PreA [Papillibacter cinnamivorans]SMC64280.1 dihydropyrimidine dehydrogenase (NAD+) subunit PreA [Papillibacter cinnamivorans DSM 12816]
MGEIPYRDILLRGEAGSCLLCSGAPCAAACPFGLEPDRILRALRFENTMGAAARLPEELPCRTCRTKDCMRACLKGKLTGPVEIDRVMEYASTLEKPGGAADLTVKFCNLRCENPFFLSSSVVANNYEMIARAFETGWAGAVFKTVGTFVPKEVSPRFDALRKEALPFVGFKNIEQISEHTLAENLSCIRQLKRDFPTKILVASIMGRSEEEWTVLSGLMTEAGADVIECNFSCPHMAADGLGSDVGQNPELVAAYTRAVRRGTHLPILAKMTPNLGNMELPAIAAYEAGADGIAAINTIKSILNVDPGSFVSGPEVDGKTSVGGYSGKAVKPIALRFIHSLSICEKLRGAELSGMGGIETWLDAAEFLALGCRTVQVTTAVMQYGYRIVEDMVEGMKYYLASQGYSSVSEIIGKALPNILPADDLNRDSISYPKFHRENCLGCGRCYLSCLDGGHQAIRQEPGSGKPLLNPRRCVGCHLCLTVCPAGAITPGTRVPKNQ